MDKIISSLCKIDDFDIKNELYINDLIKFNLNYLNLKYDDDTNLLDLIQSYTKLYFMKLYKFYLLYDHNYNPQEDITLIKLFIIPPFKNIITSKSNTTQEFTNFRGKLYKPQSGVIHRMTESESENKTMLPIGMLSERISFGKTYLLMAYVSLYANQKNIIVCGKKCIKNYEDNLKNVTINYCIIKSKKSLDKIIDLNYNLIIITDLLITNKETKEKTNLLNIFTEKFMTKFDRIIFDDFDLLKLTNDCKIPVCNFYWFVSATNNIQNSNGKFNGFDKINTYGVFKYLCRISELIFNIRCGQDYSMIDFNIPKIDTYKLNKDIDLNEFILNIDTMLFERKEMESLSLFQSNINEPYNGENKKILIVTENKDISINNSIYLNGKNIHLFEKMEYIIGVSKLLYGVNMQYLTHIIIDNYYNNDQIIQIIGRGQRIGRKYNLQVYLIQDNDENIQ